MKYIKSKVKLQFQMKVLLKIFVHDYDKLFNKR